MRMNRVLITGAGGFIGSHLVDACKALGCYVIGLDVKPWDQWTPCQAEMDEIIEGDVQEDLAGCLEHLSFDTCFHLAAESRIQPSFQHPMLNVLSNVTGTARVLELCRMNGARVIYAGSSTADDDVRKNVYAATKHVGELLGQTWHRCFDVPFAVARFYNVYGPRHVAEGRYATVVAIFERQYRAGEMLTVTGLGQQCRDFTHVTDIVEGLVDIATISSWLDGRVYPLGSGVTHQIIDVARMFVDDSRIHYIPRPPGESEYTRCNYIETNKATGWEPKHSDLKQYIQRFKDEVKGDVAA